MSGDVPFDVDEFGPLCKDFADGGGDRMAVGGEAGDGVRRDGLVQKGGWCAATIRQPLACVNYADFRDRTENFSAV
jgi:hypothetical protein